MTGLLNSDIEFICSLLTKYPNVLEAILFGSRAKGTHHPGSDVDIVLKGIDIEQSVLQISTYLNQESPLPYQFDVLDFNSIDNKELVEHIARVGISLYKKI